MYTEDEILNLKQKCEEYKLTASGSFWLAEADELVKICNGCGPERWPDLVRKITTAALKRYEPCFAIHDYDYDKHVITQADADKRLRDNMLTVWAADFGWARWITPAGIRERLIVIPGIYAAVSLGGKDAYEATTGQQDTTEKKS